MPVEIRELVIRATVIVPECDNDHKGKTSAGGDHEHAVIVRAAVEAVLKALRASKER